MSDETTDHVSGFAVPGDNTGPDKGSERDLATVCLRHRIAAILHGCILSIDETKARQVADMLTAAGFGDVAALRKERDEFAQLFDMRWRADQRAIAKWQKDTGRECVLPDHGDLVLWLLHKREEADTAGATLRAERDALAAQLSALRRTCDDAIALHDEVEKRAEQAEAKLLRVLRNNERLWIERDAALAESKRLRAVCTDAINALMSIGTLVQNDRGTWKLRNHGGDLSAMVAEVNRTVPIARAALAASAAAPAPAEATADGAGDATLCPFCGTLPDVDDEPDGCGCTIECNETDCSVNPCVYFDNEPHTTGRSFAHAAWREMAERPLLWAARKLIAEAGPYSARDDTPCCRPEDMRALQAAIAFTDGEIAAAQQQQEGG